MLETQDKPGSTEVKGHHLCLHQVYRSVSFSDIRLLLNVLFQISLSLSLRKGFSGLRFYFQCLAIPLVPSFLIKAQQCTWTGRPQRDTLQALVETGGFPSFFVFLDHHLVPQIQRNPDPTVGSFQEAPVFCVIRARSGEGSWGEAGKDPGYCVEGVSTSSVPSAFWEVLLTHVLWFPFFLVGM